MTEYTRADVRFPVDGTDCHAWLYLPAAPGPHPCVVMAHGFGAVREARLDAYAEVFARAGLAVLVFDYRGFGGSAGNPRQIVDIPAQLADWHAAIRFARDHDAIDRVAVWGTSFSGGHVLVVAASDPSVAAVVSQVPHLVLRRRRKRLPSARVIRMTLTALRDRFLPGRPRTIPLFGPGGGTALFAAGDGRIEQRFRDLLPAEHTWVNAVAARIVLALPGYRPADSVAAVRSPILFCACTDDVITPPGPVREAAKAADAELVELPGDHWGIYVGPEFEVAVRRQTEFLTQHLLP